jgi:hypothetical protein
VLQPHRPRQLTVRCARHGSATAASCGADEPVLHSGGSSIRGISACQPSNRDRGQMNPPRVARQPVRSFARPDPMLVVSKPQERRLRYSRPPCDTFPVCMGQMMGHTKRMA